ncbi:hypothetical protein KIPB_015870, partial [Kipferlia bialata]
RYISLIYLHAIPPPSSSPISHCRGGSGSHRKRDRRDRNRKRTREDEDDVASPASTVAESVSPATKRMPPSVPPSASVGPASLLRMPSAQRQLTPADPAHPQSTESLRARYMEREREEQARRAAEREREEEAKRSAERLQAPEVQERPVSSAYAALVEQREADRQERERRLG